MLGCSISELTDAAPTVLADVKASEGFFRHEQALRILLGRGDAGESFAFDRQAPAATSFGDRLYLWDGDLTVASSRSILQTARVDPATGLLVPWR